MADEQPTTDTSSSGKSMPKWAWIIGVGLLAIVAWQVSKGVFVKSINAPGGTSIDFYQPQSAADQAAALKAQQEAIRLQTQQMIDEAQKAAAANGGANGVASVKGSAPNSTNDVEQTGGDGNSAKIQGDHNHIEQHGSHNSAVIGGD